MVLHKHVTQLALTCNLVLLQIGNELHRDQSKLEHVYRVGKQTVWICVIVFGVETLGAVLAISSLIARVAEYKVCRRYTICIFRYKRLVM